MLSTVTNAILQNKKNKSPTSVPKGMFGDMGATNWYTPTTNLTDWRDRQYDTSGIASGASMLKGLKPIKEVKHKAFQFGVPEYEDIGEYGETSPEDYRGLFDASLEAASAPIRKQGKEAMRGLG